MEARSDAPYSDFEALVHSVESGAVAPLRGSWLLKLYESGGRLQRRQELPPEAFWTAAELRAILSAAQARFGDDVEAAHAALGHLFAALSYRWLAKGSPDPEGFHLELVANFLYSYLGRAHPKYPGSQEYAKHYLHYTPLNSELFKPLGLSPPDCALFWDYGVLWQKCLADEEGVQIDDRTDEQREQFGQGLRASNIWYGHAHTLTLVQPVLPPSFDGTTYDQSGWVHAPLLHGPACVLHSDSTFCRPRPARAAVLYRGLAEQRAQGLDAAPRHRCLYGAAAF